MAPFIVFAPYRQELLKNKLVFPQMRWISNLQMISTNETCALYAFV